MFNITAGHQDVRLLCKRDLKKKRKKKEMIKDSFLLDAYRRKSQVFKVVEESEYKVGVFMSMCIFRCIIFFKLPILFHP